MSGQTSGKTDEQQEEDQEEDSSAALELRLQRDHEAPAIARAALTGRCEDLGLGEPLCYTVVLLTSEVVSNAVLHSRGPADGSIVLTVITFDDTIRVEVTDPGHGFTPKPRDPARIDGGYGLYLLAKTARGWGVDTVGGRTRVWFELDLPG